MDTNQVLDKLDTFPDDELWTVVNHRLSSTDATRLHYLGSEEKRGNLTPEEQREFDNLIAQVNHDMLLRSKALMLLKEHGHDITSYAKTDV